MLHLISAVMLGWIAAVHSRAGWPQTAIAFLFLAAAVVNAAAAGPMVVGWLQ